MPEKPGGRGVLTVARRRPVITGLLAAILTAIAAVAVLRPGSSPAEYASLPVPCGILTAATLARYLPDATSQTALVPTRSGPSQISACGWSGGTGGLNRSLMVTPVP
jgi:hypothetical protein